ncbi:uncharacterized protein AKAME5_000441300 [Lates japonicus]|uniref:Uncharacterized protein n=1 Tax=Lates japonicus TaxID=270547 RepID=A0AAD3MCE5_LATJO|nr:uncharacterized protein AKAME5_000441300 [Lates japonicus]
MSTLCSTSRAAFSGNTGPACRRFISWRFLDPIGSSLVPVVGTDEGQQTRCLSSPYLRGHGVNLRNLQPLARATKTANALAPSPVRMALVNARSLANKTSILKDFFESHRLDFLDATETWIPIGRWAVEEA